MKKKIRTIITMSAVVVTSCMISGCMSPGGLSLFDKSQHHHYECTPNIKERVEVLEQKVQALETPSQTSQTPLNEQ